MAKSKDQKRQEALERLTANIGDRMANGNNVTYAHRKEYNSLKEKLAPTGRTHPGKI